jgi:hypothetical protein
MNLGALWPYALALVLLLAAVIVVLLVLVLRKSAKVSQFSDTEEPHEDDVKKEQPEQQPSDIADHVMITSAFRRARSVLASLSDRNQYRTALHLVIGADGSREPGFLSRMAASGLRLVYDDPVREGLAFGDGGGFYFFTDGIVLDLAGPQVLAADGVTSEAQGWRTILRELRNLRPKRPADGIILTVSCTDLYEARNVESRLAARADRLHRKLWEVQRELGFRLPVYVLVTGCEKKLTGFSDLCISLPQSTRGQMIGWSSPHALHVPYNPSWLDEAFDDLHRDLANMQMDLFAGGQRPKGVLLFPWSLRELKKPLRTFLNHLFRSSAYHEGMILRGFYFCGTNAGDSLFTSDLIEDKTFAESGLAVPTSRTKMGRDRKVLGLQIANAAAAMLFAGGLLWAWAAFRHENTVLKPLLDNAIRAKTLRYSVASTDEAQMATEILDGMSKIDFHHYRSVFVPTSWFSSFDDKLRSALVTTFSTIILDSIEARLEKKVESAMSEATMRIVPEGGGGAQRTLFSRSGADTIMPIEEMHEFKALQQFVAQLQQIEHHGRMLNDLSQAGTGELQSLGQLVDFSFGHPLSSRFFRNGELYEHALKTARSTSNFNPASYQAQSSETARLLAEDLYHRLYVRNPFLTRFSTLESALSAGASAQETNAEQFRHLAQNMRLLENDLAGPELQWAFRPNFDLGPSYNAVLTAMNQSGFFGPETASAIRQRGASGWSDFTLRLAAATPVTGSILSTRDGRAEMKLSTDTLLLESAIQAFLHQGFVAAAEGETSLITTLGPGERLIWNTRLLQQSVNVYTSYDRFREKGLKLFSPELQGAVDGAARDHVSVQMQDLLKAAQTIEAAPSTPTNAVLEEELQNGIDRFTAAAKLVDQNLDLFVTLDTTKPRTDLIAIMTAEGNRLLRMNDELMTRNAPYTMSNDFAWRDGSTPPSPAAWGARDPAELALYLDATRGRLAHLARSYAKPLLSWMANAGTDDLPEQIELVSRWQSILDDLDDYDAKKPANAPAALEDYIAGAMTKVTTKDCRGAVLASRPQRRNGFLATRLDQLSRQLSDVCWGNATQDAVRSYTEIAGFFNDKLKGRYPFAKKKPGSTDREADPEDIRRFYALFDKSDALLRSIPADKNYGWPLQGARPFLENMREVRKFFAVYLDPAKEKKQPEVDIETEFRTLQKFETAGNEIIRWTLRVGDKTITERDKATKLRWVPDAPVELSLKWASNAEHEPVLTEPQRGRSVEDRVVRYEFTNKWALLYALTELQATADDLDPNADALPVTLSLKVATKPVAEGVQPLPREAQVFMRLGLVTPEGAPLRMPDFPAEAPKLESFVIGDAQQ